MGVDLGSARGKIEIDASGIYSEMQKAEKSIRTFQSGVATAMVGVGVAIGGVTTAARLMQKGWETLERGAELNALEDRFNRLADSIGSSGDALRDRLEDATNGMMSDAKLMESAADIMSLGLGKTEDQTVQLATVVGKLGWDMQQVTMTMANNSKLRLDTLGLSVTDVETRVEALREEGMSLDEAFDLAVIEAGEAKIELLGDASERTEGQVMRLSAALEDARDAFGAAFAEKLAADVKDLGDSAEALGDNMAYAAEGAGRLTASLAGGAIKSAAFVGQMGHFTALSQQVEAAGGNLDQFKEKYYQVFAGGRGAPEQVGAAIADLTAELERLNGITAGTEAWANDLWGVQAAAVAVGEAAPEAVEQTAEELEKAAEKQREYEQAANRVTRQIELYSRRGEAAAATNRRIAEETGYTVYELAQMGITAEEAMERTAKATEDAAARAAAAFAAVQGDYAIELPEADKPLVTPQQDVTITTRVSGPTAEQAALAARYTAELDRLREAYTELTGGIGTFGMEQGKLDEKIAQTVGEIAHYEGLLAGIPPTINDVSTSQQNLSVNVDAARQALYRQLVDIGAAPELVTAYAAAVGIMSDEQAEAALVAQRLQLEIEALALKMKEQPDFSLDEAMAELDALILKLEGGVEPAATALATDVPLALAPMSEEMSTQATAAGEAVPTNIATGITDTLDEATTAATDAADAIVQAVRDAHGIESPSSVFAEIGGQDIAGFVAGVEDSQGDAVGAMERVGQATVDAWDATIEAADGISTAIMDGVIAGLEAKRGELVAKMEEIAREAYQAAMTEIDAHSPSQLFIDYGAETIIGAIIIGLDEEKDTLYGKMTEIASDLYRVASSGLAWLGDPLELQLEAQDDAIDKTTERMTTAFDALRTTFGDTVVDNLLAMSSADRAYFTSFLRGSSAYQNNIDTQLRVDEALSQAGELNRLEQERLQQQEALADVEEKRLELERERSRLDFLQSQIDLVDTIHELGLSTSILEGLELGLDANAGDLVEAMQRVIRKLIEAAEGELEIASPSRVGYGLTANFMDAMERGIAENAQGPVGALVDAYEAMQDASERMVLAGMMPGSNWPGVAPTGGAGRVEMRQAVTIYGGMHVTAEQMPRDSLRDLYYADLAY